MTIQTDNYGIGASGTASQKFTLTAPNNGQLKIGRGVLGAETTFPLVINADDSISGNMGIGAGQTWQNVTGSRVLGTTYTNSTGKPIMVTVGGNTNGTTGNMILEIGGVIMQQMTWNLTSGTYPISFSGIVPNGTTYRVYSFAGTAMIVSAWGEMR